MIELLHIDCMEYMKEVPDKFFELAIVDPEYRHTNDPTKDMRKNGTMKNFRGKPKSEYFFELMRISKNQIIWGANNFELGFKGFVVWDKVMPMDFTMSMAEIAAVSDGLSTISKIIKIRVSGAEDRIHPTQKPVKLYKWLLKNYAKEGDKIFDSHGGSMSIAIACHDMKFDLTLCEIDKDYYEAGVKRYENHKKQLQLF